MNYCVYAYVFDDGMTYVGLTCDPHKRHKQHCREAKSQVFRYSAKSGLKIPKMTVLTEFMSGDKAQQAEHDHLCAVPPDRRLNKGPTGVGTGSLGWTSKRMTPEMIKAWFKDYIEKNRPRLQKMWKNYYDRHREEIRKKAAAYRAKNAEVIRAKKAEYYQSHKEKYAIEGRKRYLRNKALGKIKKHVGPQPYNPEYYRRNKDKFLARKRRWKARCKLKKIFKPLQVKLLTYEEKKGENTDE